MSFEVVTLSWLWVEQTFLMARKHINQKQRKGRDFLKETIMIPFFILAFTGYLFYNINMIYSTPDVYTLHNLPPLSKSATWGIFNMDAKQNNDNFYIQGYNLLYAPQDHPAVVDLINSLTAIYPDVTPVGCDDWDDLFDSYRTNIFKTWAAINFNLTHEQIATNSFVPDQAAATNVDYTIYINSNYADLPTDSDLGDQGDNVFNDLQAPADLWWESGYMTLQNFVSTYLAKQYDSVPSTFTVSVLFRFLNHHFIFVLES